jgi:hypothetical protein
VASFSLSGAQLRKSQRVAIAKEVPCAVMVVGSVGCRREQKYAFGESGAHTKKNS